MSEGLQGKFGPLTNEQCEFILTLATAYAMAPQGSFAQAKLRMVLVDEVVRFGLRVQDILTHDEVIAIRPIDDEVKA